MDAVFEIDLVKDNLAVEFQYQRFSIGNVIIVVWRTLTVTGECFTDTQAGMT